jgi:ATP-dependent DNA helicase RecG
VISALHGRTTDDLTRLISAGPGERIAFAPGNTGVAKLAETLAALANGHGGVLLVGVTTSGKPTGIADSADTRAVVHAAGLLAFPPLILPLPQAVEHEGKQFCLVEVPPGLPQVYSVDGRYLTRTGAQNRLLSAAELGALLLARGEAGFESRPALGATLDDLDPVQVQAYASLLGYPPTGFPDSPKYPSATNDLREGSDGYNALFSRGCLTQTADGTIPSYAGILLFGRHPQRFLRNAQITLVRYAGPQMGDEFLRHDAAGALPDQIRQAEAFVTANMRRGMRLTGFTRQETAEYPLGVVREAIVNAVAHRDYAVRGDDIRVLMFSDHMEVYSPGRLPGHVTLDNLATERFSRNEAIVQALSDLGFVERLGYGIDRMVTSMAEAGLPAPVFEETVAGFRVTLRGRGEELVSPEAAPRWGNRRLDPRQERALAYLAERGTITNREFRELCPELSDETIRRELADLVDQGLIVKVGERKATYYMLK